MPDELLQRFHDTAIRLRRSKGWIINDAVREGLRREDLLQRRDADTRRPCPSWMPAKWSKAKEVLAWIDSWGSKNEREQPR
ncbi:hypothetical protein [Halochromatium glycolicum]|uniref:Uncharacterized protein n=1 Tax=Halochromatium glycolicum TaxID=85075 RepID=A0AAJ0U367_9GAMM|nr:hypothetical protein [Halochromatium glycolicum]MBK1704387.1 hypothetical protein [Halochromatium glycolicum]